jgi:acyl-CoA synthetase (AMP-forming)/AMP-acid ligase II
MLGEAPRGYIEEETLVELLGRRASEQPGRLAYVFLERGEREVARLEYGELDRRARKVAALLAAAGARRERAILLYPQGLDFVSAFFGCLYASTVAVPVLPPDPRGAVRTLPRLRAVAKDSAAKFILTTSGLLAHRDTFVEHAPELAELVWLATDLLSDEAPGFVDSSVEPSTIAFLQYTSGSTSAPRGVMISHQNLLHNAASVKTLFEQDRESVLVTWLPMYHDMGLIGGLLQPLYAGYPDYIMAPVDFLKHPVKWLRAISKYRATTSGGPNFAYELCVRKVTHEQKQELDLSTWRTAFCGAEPVNPETLRRFAEAFAGCGFDPRSFYPCYGLAEATLVVTAGRRRLPQQVARFAALQLAQNQAVAVEGEDASRALTGCGGAPSGLTVKIVDPTALEELPAGRVGEVWVSGASVATGYWNRPDATEEVFHAHTNSGAGPYLRTGDLGFMQNGELFICGRIKELIIVGGSNHYPQDIERTVEARVPLLRPGTVAAFSIELEGEEKVVVLVETASQALERSGLTAEALMTVVRECVFTEHRLPVHAVELVRPGSIPKTSSGKLERARCRKLYLSRELSSKEP